VIPHHEFISAYRTVTQYDQLVAS